MVDLCNDNTVLRHPNTGLDAIQHTRGIGLYLQNLRQNVFVCFCALEPMPMPVPELVPELDPVLGLEVASEPELKPVPVLELELGFD